MHMRISPKCQTYSSHFQQPVIEHKSSANPNSGYLRLLISAFNLYMAFSGYEFLEKAAIISIIIKDILCSVWKNNYTINNHQNGRNNGNHNIANDTVSIFGQISPIRLIGKSLAVGGAALIGLYATRIPAINEASCIVGGLKDAVKSSAIVSAAIQIGESIINYRQEKPRQWVPFLFHCKVRKEEFEEDDLLSVAGASPEKSYDSFAR